VDPRDLGCRCDECPLGRHHRRLATWAPVLPEVNAGAKYAIIAEAPGKTEVIKGVPLIGESGKLTMRYLEEAAGLCREDVVLDNALLCWPPGDDLDAFMGQYVRQVNRRVKKEIERCKKADEPSKLHMIPSPVECCRPHIVRRLRHNPGEPYTPNALLLGAISYESVVGRRKAIRDVRGSFIELWHIGAAILQTPDVEGWTPPRGAARLQVTPTYHPAFVMREGNWDWAVHRDFERFFGWVRGDLEWVPPKLYHYKPSPAQLEAFLYGPESPRWFGVDTETTMPDRGVKPKLRTIQIAHQDGGVVIPFLSVRGDVTFVPLRDGHGRSSYYNQEDGNAIVALLRRFLRDAGRGKVGHNFGYFDIPVLADALGMSEDDIVAYQDTVLHFRAAHTGLNRKFYTLGTLYTNVKDWKNASGSDRQIAVKPRSDMELATYGNTDSTVNARVFPPLLQRVRDRGQVEVVQLDHSTQKVCREMHALGFFVDQKKRAEMEKECSTRYAECITEMQKILRRPAFNPRSRNQLLDLVYDEWKLPVLVVTETMEPAVDDNAIRKFMADPSCDPDQKRVFELIRESRGLDKRSGTYLGPARLCTDLRLASDGKTKIGGRTWPDGRLRPHYNSHTPSTGRISSSDPNGQNWNGDDKVILVAEYGYADEHVYVGADFDQIELRLMVAAAGIKSYWRVFELGGDPHGMTALIVYGDIFRQALLACLTPAQQVAFNRTGVPVKVEEWPEQQIARLEARLETRQDERGTPLSSTDLVVDEHVLKDLKRSYKLYKSLRKFAKSFVYLVIYGGSPKTAWENLSAAEDDKGRLVFPNLPFEEVEAAHATWLEGVPEIQPYWGALVAFATQNGYIAEPVMGRIRDFPVIDDPNKVYNMPIQGGAGIIMARGLKALRARIRPGQYGKSTGIVNQCHDAIVVECPKSAAEEVKQHMTQSMETEWNGMRFPATPKVGRDWKEAA